MCNEQNVHVASTYKILIKIDNYISFHNILIKLRLNSF